MPRRNAAASSRKKNAMITRQKKANIAMAEVPSSYEDAGMVNSTAVDYQMARDDRNPRIDSEFVNVVGCWETELLTTAATINNSRNGAKHYSVT